MLASPTKRKWLILLCTAFLIIMFLNVPANHTVSPQPITFIGTMDRQLLKNWRGFSQDETNGLSQLGKILFLQDDPPEAPHRRYKILIWKYWKLIESRHAKQYGEKKVDPFADCSVKNCDVSGEDSDLDSADLVIFHMQRMKKSDLPVEHRQGQIWAFLTDESPYHMFQSTTNISEFDGVFNWSMTYRMDSDIPVPYGRTVVRMGAANESYKFKIQKRRDVLVTVLASNCGGRNHRWKYVEELQKYIKVDFYGSCGQLKTCPGHFKKDCSDIDNYMFYLAFENSNCRDYVTEKAFWNAYEKNSIPIVMGASKDSYSKILPPHSYLNIEDFAKPEDLAAYVLYLNQTGNFLDFYRWKSDFEVRNEHGYFQSRSYHLCRACQAINYNSKQEKSYSTMKQFWNADKDCYPAWDA